MPSPFPGMDPYLELPWLWPDVHRELISAARAQLTPQLRPRYVARLEERVYVTTEDDPDHALYYPDIRLAARNGAGGGKRRKGKAKSRPASAADEPVVVTTMTADEVREARIEIRPAGTGDVVAVIECLSPSNKLAGSAGRESFVRKRREILASDAHWCEIDLLRAGTRPAFDALLPPHEYLIHLSPVGLRPRGRVWSVRLARRLPAITIPLRDGDPDVRLDLQSVLDTAYDRAGYDMSVDYTTDPTPPLPPDLAAWADQLLREKGLR